MSDTIELCIIEGIALLPFAAIILFILYAVLTKGSKTSDKD